MSNVKRAFRRVAKRTPVGGQSEGGKSGKTSRSRSAEPSAKDCSEQQNPNIGSETPSVATMVAKINQAIDRDGLFNIETLDTIERYSGSLFNPDCGDEMFEIIEDSDREVAAELRNQLGISAIDWKSLEKVGEALHSVPSEFRDRLSAREIFLLPHIKLHLGSDYLFKNAFNLDRFMPSRQGKGSDGKQVTTGSTPPDDSKCLGGKDSLQISERVAEMNQAIDRYGLLNLTTLDTIARHLREAQVAAWKPLLYQLFAPCRANRLALQQAGLAVTESDWFSLSKVRDGMTAVPAEFQGKLTVREFYFLGHVYFARDMNPQVFVEEMFKFEEFVKSHPGAVPKPSPEG